MTQLTPEQAAAIAAQTGYPRAWKHAEGPNPIVGVYLGDSEGQNRYGDTKRIRLIQDAEGQRWAVWLLGQLDVQWDELETTPEHGDVLSFWVSQDVKTSAGGHDYRPSKIVHVPKAALPSPNPAASPVAGHDTEVDRGAEGSAGKQPRFHNYEIELKACGQWPPTDPVILWIDTHDDSQVRAALEARRANRQS